MESLLPILINTIGGGAGGFLGNMVKKNALGMVGNLLAGAVGGNVLPFIIKLLTGAGAAATTADAAAASGFEPMSLISAVVGGGAGSLLGGLLKK